MNIFVIYVHTSVFLIRVPKHESMYVGQAGVRMLICWVFDHIWAYFRTFFNPPANINVVWFFQNAVFCIRGSCIGRVAKALWRIYDEQRISISSWFCLFPYFVCVLIAFAAYFFFAYFGLCAHRILSTGTSAHRTSTCIISYCLANHAYSTSIHFHRNRNSFWNRQYETLCYQQLAYTRQNKYRITLLVYSNLSSNAGCYSDVFCSVPALWEVLIVLIYSSHG
jgi:hypothetical protein